MNEETRNEEMEKRGQLSKKCITLEMKWHGRVRYKMKTYERYIGYEAGKTLQALLLAIGDILQGTEFGFPFTSEGTTSYNF